MNVISSIGNKKLKRMNKFLVFCITVLGMISISCTQKEEVEEIIPLQEIKPNQNHSINAVLWHQTAAEYKALCYQTYSLAKLQLDKKLQMHAYPYELPPAIIMDLDETVLDNSFFNAQLILDSANYTKDKWKGWSDLMTAGSVPGAIEFIQYAKSKGVAVIFISNRRGNEVENTKNNLESLGLSELDTANFYFRTSERSKKGRRDEVTKNYDILMLFGDNLADFSAIFDQRTVADRSQLVDSLQQDFGSHFIVLPNVLYGEWEGALFDYQYDWTDAQKDSIRLSWLKGY